MLTDGTLLQGRYRVVRKLASGGMGTVYEATDERLDAVVALKETAFDGEEMRRHFEREARLLARLSHPALPRVSDHFAEGGGQFLVMQFVEGEDLETLRRQEGGAFSVARVLAWADELLDVLEYLHAQRPPVVHRDIKPQNLKLSARGRIILLDFSLAKGYVSRASTQEPALSIHGATREYAPLEQLEGSGTDARSDLFSLAVTLYQLMTGVMPPAVMTRLSALHNNQPDPLRPAYEVNPHVPPEVSAVLDSAMSVARDERPASASEMRLRLLKAGQRQEGIGTASTILMTPTISDEAAQDATTNEPPSDFESTTQRTVGDLTATQRHHLEYWTAFRDYMEGRGSFITPTKPPKEYWMSFAVGRSGFGLDAYNGMRDKWIGVGLILSGSDAKPHFHLLSLEKGPIEDEVGARLEWQEKPSQKNSVITLKLGNVDPTNRQGWPAQHEWLLDKLEAFHKAFAQRVRSLRAAEYAPSSEPTPAQGVGGTEEAAVQPPGSHAVAAMPPPRARDLPPLSTFSRVSLVFIGAALLVSAAGLINSRLSGNRPSPPSNLRPSVTNSAANYTPPADASALTREEFEAHKDYFKGLAARNPGERIGDGPDDFWLWVQVRRWLADELGEETDRISVSVINGRVILVGNVSSERRRLRAHAAVARIKGVKEVVAILAVPPTNQRTSPNK